MRRPRPLLPLYAASAVLTFGEGSFGLLVPPYMHSRHVSPVVIGGAFSVYGVVSLASRIPAGALYRSQRAWLLIASGTVISSLAFALVTRTANPTLLTIFVALDGAGFAIATTASMAALIERRPPGSDAGSIMGWYTGSLGAGYAAAGFLGGWLGGSIGPGSAILLLALVPLVAGILLSLVVRATIPLRKARPATQVAWWHGFRGLSGLVWLAFAVTLYINLVSGVVLTFFPVYGLAIGLTLAQVGFLQGMHGLAAAVVRFLSGMVFRFVSYERTLSLTVLLSGCSVVVIGGFRTLAVLAVAWAALGLTRGLLRVSSAALVTDAAGDDDARHGASSGVYLAGLDLGKVLGPLLGGLGADIVGLRTTFLLAGIAFPVIYFALALPLRRRPIAPIRDTPAGAPSTLA